MKEEVLYTAWKNLNRNTKGTGFDSLTIQQVEASGVENFIRSVKKELKSEKYAAGEVKRVKIPKKNGETRQLGILTLKDRLVQGAVKLVLEPIFEADFENCSYGYRAYRSAKLASLEVYKWLETGNIHYLKGDIEDCFDSVPHDKLMKVLKTRIEDELILSLIEDWLKKGSVESSSGKYSGKGLLQGGIISPLLLNFYLDQFDNQWAEIGLKNIEGDSVEHLVRFADDFVILSKEWINPDRVEAVLDVLGLEFNKEKTYVGTAANGFEFVGFYFQEIVDEKGFERSIKIIPTEGSIEKVIKSIESMGCVEKAIFDHKNENGAPKRSIKNISNVVDPWVNYYRHTDYAVGLERIKQSVNKWIKEFT
ncbi:reverse transcriptase domain-containing protein [Methanosarcina vacuolata]|uniref:reverse transcriptase domain-containing protein n=1 Tax=Methanosarcina vacuolata TaxID=2215 RepID=UPI001E4A74BD|nr:reverse transcriptase domain-containing protein [Methanosarcina vacuolata]